MRLIDADALKEYIHNQDGRPFIGITIGEAFQMMVDEQPTIEERKRGEWIVYKAPDQYHCGMVKCPFCDEDMIAESDEYNYCPNCGAKMEGNT